MIGKETIKQVVVRMCLSEGLTTSQPGTHASQLGMVNSFLGSNASHQIFLTGNTCLDRNQYLLLGAVGFYLCFEAITTTAPGSSG